MPTATIKKNKNAKTNKDKKDELLLDSLEIKGYRCFEHLTIEKLGRVNLIVGKNNVGKTALLEALWIYSENGGNFVFAEIAFDRNERLRNEFDGNKTYQIYDTRYFSEYRHLFYKRPTPLTKQNEFYNGEFEIGDITNSEKKIIVRLKNNSSPVLEWTYVGRPYLKIKNYFVKTSKIKPLELLELWRNVELRISEEFVTSALKIIASNLISVRLTEYPEIDSPKIPIARVKEISEPVPLLSLGEGMNRMFVIALALANCQNGILILDEIESGLHYSVLPDVWKLIFKTAKELNVQVFATTHSKDCIEAFAQAAYDSPEEGVLTRLERQGEKIVAKTIAEETLVDAVDYGVEVR